MMLPATGGVAAPPVVGFITAATGNPAYSMYLIMALYLLSGTALLVTLRGASPRGR